MLGEIVLVLSLLLAPASGVQVSSPSADGSGQPDSRETSLATCGSDALSMAGDGVFLPAPMCQNSGPCRSDAECCSHNCGIKCPGWTASRMEPGCLPCAK